MPLAKPTKPTESKIPKTPEQGLSFNGVSFVPHLGVQGLADENEQ